MKQIFSVFLIIAWTFSSYSQTRCFTYDAAGNRTVRMACVLPLNNSDLIDGVHRHLVGSMWGNYTVIE